MITEEDLRRILQGEIEKHGNNELAKMYGVDKALISLAANKKRNIGKNLAFKMGYIKKIVFEKISTKKR